MKTKLQLGGIWLDDCRIPYQNEDDKEVYKNCFPIGIDSNIYGGNSYTNSKTKYTEPAKLNGRFPANLLVCDDILNDGNITKSTGGTGIAPINYKLSKNSSSQNIFNYGDSGSYSRYFDLDKWAEKQNDFSIEK